MTDDEAHGSGSGCPPETALLHPHRTGLCGLDQAIHFFRNKRHPQEMGASEISRFLSYLATEKHAAASTQNQALNALVFLYKKVLQKEVGELGPAERAKKPERLPTVMSRGESGMPSCPCIGPTIGMPPGRPGFISVLTSIAAFPKNLPHWNGWRPCARISRTGACRWKQRGRCYSEILH